MGFLSNLFNKDKKKEDKQDKRKNGGEYENSSSDDDRFSRYRTTRSSMHFGDRFLSNPTACYQSVGKKDPKGARSCPGAELSDNDSPVREMPFRLRTSLRQSSQREDRKRRNSAFPDRRDPSRYRHLIDTSSGDEEILEYRKHSFRNIPRSVRLVPHSPFPSSPPRERGNRKRLDVGRHKIRPEKISMYDFALGTFKRVLEEVQQGVGIVLPESFKEFTEAPKNPRPKGWALRSTKKTGRYDPLARKLVDDLIEQYFSNGKKLRPDEAEKRMRERNDILPAQRMTFDQIRNRITTLLSQKKEHQRKRDLAEEGISLDDIEEEVDLERPLDEDDLIITSDEIYDLVHSNMEFFDNPSEPVFSDFGEFEHEVVDSIRRENKELEKQNEALRAELEKLKFDSFKRAESEQMQRTNQFNSSIDHQGLLVPRTSTPSPPIGHFFGHFPYPSPLVRPSSSSRADSVRNYRMSSATPPIVPPLTGEINATFTVPNASSLLLSTESSLKSSRVPQGNRDERLLDIRPVSPPRLHQRSDSNLSLRDYEFVNDSELPIDNGDKGRNEEDN
ncbi:hypothetical protein PRIPAC_86382 [Pristionchus pacificus]|uniref:Uncharacterized protein n=1 Tax=Pristionchus pacificus TaxID=54126 RepID=A0A2A6CCG2_PRIPA|nr:hypothetical protein PRIPAC_86382 [Pristionchus pacificus]|eukprot:PDM75778.1 hypothetical protein PRIPAC_40157 [Pristionchus pacificus]